MKHVSGCERSGIRKLVMLAICIGWEVADGADKLRNGEGKKSRS